MVDYYFVYNASWKAKEQYTSFLNNIVTEFSNLGWTRLAILYIGKQPIAAQLWFVNARKAYIFRLAYDEEWKSYSPGSILTGFLMEYVLDIDKVHEIDFLTGNDSYKQDWMSIRRECTALSCIKIKKTKGKYIRIFERLKSTLLRIQKKNLTEI